MWKLMKKCWIVKTVKEILRDKTITLPTSVLGLTLFQHLCQYKNPVNILDEENDVLIEDAEVSERNNNALLENNALLKTPNEVMQES